MTLLVNHPDADEIRERLKQNIVLRRLKKRAFREEDRRFLVEGAQGVSEALAAGRLEALFTMVGVGVLALGHELNRIAAD